MGRTRLLGEKLDCFSKRWRKYLSADVTLMSMVSLGGSSLISGTLMGAQPPNASAAATPVQTKRGVIGRDARSNAQIEISSLNDVKNLKVGLLSNWRAISGQVRDRKIGFLGLFYSSRFVRHSLAAD